MQTKFSATCGCLLLTGMMVGCDSRPAPAKEPAKSTSTADAAPAAGPAKESVEIRTSATPESTPSKTTNPAESASAETMLIGPLYFKIPSGWKSQKPGNEMRLGELRVVGQTEDVADLSKGCLVTFTRLGGTVEMNVERWKAQVIGADGKPASATTDRFETAGVVVHTVEMTGNYQDGMPGGAKTARPDWMFRGAVIETPERFTFIRMTGPVEAMTAAKPGWEHLIRTFTVGK